MTCVICVGVEAKPVLALEGKLSLNYTQTGLRTLAAQDTLSVSDSLWTTAGATDRPRGPRIWTLMSLGAPRSLPDPPPQET